MKAVPPTNPKLLAAPLVSVVVVTYNRAHEIARCLDSIFLSTFTDFEVIVVDNASHDSTVPILNDRFSGRITLIEAGSNLMAAGGRNLGAKRAKGKLLAFIDSDNVVHPQMLEHLTAKMESDAGAGMVGPFMYYFVQPRRVWCGGADINFWTGKTTYLFANQEHPDPPRQAPYEVGHIPNIFMCRVPDFVALDGFFEPYQIMFEESDFAEKLKRHGKQIFIVPAARACHDVPILNDGSLRAFGLQSFDRAFLLSRNRVLFMKRNASFSQFVVFAFLFLPLFTAYYLKIILGHRRFDIARAYLLGVVRGLFWKT